MVSFTLERKLYAGQFNGFNAYLLYLKYKTKLCTQSVVLLVVSFNI